MNKHYTFVRGVLSFAFAFLLVHFSTHAQTNFGAFQDNNYLNANNWTNGLPGPGNDANIGGGQTAEITTDHTVNYTLTSYANLKVTATLTIATGAQLNNYSGSNFNLEGVGSLQNNGSIDQRGGLVIGQSALFVQNAGGALSTTGSAVVINNGTANIGGTYTNLGELRNNGQLTLNATMQVNGTLKNGGTLNQTAGQVTIANGATLLNQAGATYALVGGAVLDNQGTYNNLGQHNNNGQFTSNGTVNNDGQFSNLSGGSVESFFHFENNGSFLNTGGASVLNEFEFDNSGTFTNDAFFDNGAALNNKGGGSFVNVAGAQINNQFGATISNNDLFSNEGDILSVGDVINAGTFVNVGSIYTNTGGAIVNSGNFTNDNLLSNLEEITNTGSFFNNGQLQNDSGGVFTNEGELYNNQPARISNQFDLVNNANLFNFGTIENGVRLFNFGFFENNGYLINIGDFLNAASGTFENTAAPTTTGSNGGVIENANGGVFTNDGILNNYDEIFNFACSSFINNGIINNYYWWTNYSLFFNYGTFNELPYHQMNMDGGVEITGPTNDLICENVTISLDEFGAAKIQGTALSVTAYDDCSTLILRVNDQDEVTLTCADPGENILTLEISDRKGNAVKCSSTVTLVDDRAPELTNCPDDIFIVATSTETPADWTPPSATDNCGPVNVTSTHIPGDLFPIGMTEVTYSAQDGAGNASAPCTFKVTSVPPGDCADVASVRQVNSTHDNCGQWCNDYVLTFGSGNCYTAGDDLIFVEYTDGSALLTGSVLQNGERGFVDVCFTGRTDTPPSGSPKLELCVQQGGNDWTFYTSFSGKINLAGGDEVHIQRFGPAFQMGIGGNLQEPDVPGASGWFTMNGDSHGGDFNFGLGAARNCQNSIYLEAECAVYGSKWTVVNDANASGGKALLPPSQYSYDYAPLNTADLITFTADVAQAGSYRIFARASTPNGNADSYWVRVNGGQWVKWNKINNDNYSAQYQWDLTGEWRGGANATPLTFHLNAGANTIQFSWREPLACLDKIFITAIAKKPTGTGGDSQNCDQPNPPNGDCQNVTVTINPDDYGSETTWKLKDANGNVVASGGPYQDWSYATQTSTVCLPDGCYTFKINDSYGDGICCEYGNGSYEVKNAAGQVLASGGSFGHSETKTVCLNDTPDVDDCNRNALFVVGNATLNNSDSAIKDRLEGLGFVVTVQDDNYCQTADADDKGLILISSTVSSGKVGNKYRNVAVPVINWEGWLMDNLKMTGGETHYDYGNGTTAEMTIQDGNHPIAQGGSGNVPLFSAPQTVTWGYPTSGATRIGYVPNNPDCVMLFTYDTGAHMVGMDAPARRVGFYLHNATAHRMTNIGWTIFDRTVQWASGCDLGVYARAASDEVLTLAANNYHNRTVRLNWVNNTGYKNEFFIVERSVDGRSWEAINEMNAFDEENKSAESFQDVDPAPLMGVSYYRVSAQLLDGTFIHSEIQAVDLTDIVEYDVYPNPATTFAKVNLEQLVGEQNVRIMLYDWAGKPLQNIEIDVVESPDYPLDLNLYKSGIYSVVVIAKDRHPRTKKLIISK